MGQQERGEPLRALNLLRSMYDPDDPSDEFDPDNLSDDWADGDPDEPDDDQDDGDDAEARHAILVAECRESCIYCVGGCKYALGGDPTEFEYRADFEYR
jgi:hypothetical protein